MLAARFSMYESHPELTELYRHAMEARCAFLCAALTIERITGRSIAGVELDVIAAFDRGQTAESLSRLALPERRRRPRPRS